MSVQQVATDAFGNGLGSSIAEELLGKPQDFTSAFIQAASQPLAPQAGIQIADSGMIFSDTGPSTRVLPEVTIRASRIDSDPYGLGGLTVAEGMVLFGQVARSGRETAVQVETPMNGWMRAQNIGIGVGSNLAGAAEGIGYQFGVTGSQQERANWAIQSSQAAIVGMQTLVSDFPGAIKRTWNGLMSDDPLAVQGSAANVTGAALSVGGLAAGGLGRSVGAAGRTAADAALATSRWLAHKAAEMAEAAVFRMGGIAYVVPSKVRLTGIVKNATNASGLSSPYGIAGRNALLEAVGKTESLADAKTLASDYKIFVRLTEQAEGIFAKSGVTYLTPGELVKMESDPWTRNIFEGTARDRIFKGLIEAEQMNGRFLNYQMTPQGARGIDLFTVDKKLGFDLATTNGWPSHVVKYKNDYGTILPLLC